MRLPGRLAAAIAVLEDIEARKRPASEALKGWGLNNRFAGAGDRAAIGNLVYDGLRRRASHAHAMGEDTPRALVLSVAVRDWGERVSDLNAAFAEDRFAPAPITEAEAARLEAEATLADASDAVRADVPGWTAPGIAANFGGDWVAHGHAMTARPPLDLRVNRLKADRERVEKSLKRFSPAPTGIAPDGLRLAAGPRDARTPNVTADEGYQKGWFEIQDEGSQIVARLVGAEPGEQVLDLCAGAGGKTLAMAAMMQNKGQIFAYDSDRARLAPIYDRLKRNGVRNAQTRSPEPGALEDLAGRMDRVVIDAPCTGTGTWRRRPDAKWKLAEDQLAQRVAEQAAILAEGRRFVKPGGVLAYITCSILAAENDEQVAAFLESNEEFRLRDARAAWAEAFGEADRAVFTPGGGIALSPLTTDTDGFYIALLERKS
ncbi:RsmB/NOP family class I SAM-dependent RNA methyltransferase [Arsenicitalea aurantiaca]|uniref:RsmB/NOP family class I SAM-dependent RNA methyltransferase n=1 Tax=Arsenicitalea aurantiaca TaxID=1783274 RepID=A0A433X3A9_9HYPH|nr:RsmB/NOP family class I SAM-dependent RNA methyltransferase [Arsenicitalea aurantiaca]RUT28555.1 RsmB/NOP family class I SAM-dependent RNA methyltransferase [Arsenicitalea aurantiaca]